MIDADIHLPKHNPGRAARLASPGRLRRLLRRRIVQLTAAAIIGGIIGAIAGAIGEHIAHELNAPTAAHQAPEPIVDVQLTAPPECAEALTEAGRAIDLAEAFGTGMKDLHGKDGGVHSFRKGGQHWRDSDRFIKDLDELAKQYEKAADDCKEDN